MKNLKVNGAPWQYMESESPYDSDEHLVLFVSPRNNGFCLPKMCVKRVWQNVHRDNYIFRDSMGAFEADEITDEELVAFILSEFSYEVGVCAK